MKQSAVPRLGQAKQLILVLYEGQVQQTGSHFNPAWPRRAGLYGFLGYLGRFFSVAGKKASFDMGLCKLG
jgi:hypothetical protein